jgi:predicted metal-dependent hydrolase
LYNIAYGTKNIAFNIERKNTLKNTYINVDTNGVLVKTNDKTTIEEVNKMVQKKSAWISKKLDVFKSITINKDIRTGARLYYMGRSYYVNMIKDETAETITIDFTHSKFNITTPSQFTKTALNEKIESFYKQKAIEKIIPLTKKWAKVMGVMPEHISFRYSKNRWGSCSSANRISFNYHLVKLSSSLIEYVVIHELTHITFQNHSKDFWQGVRKYLADYKIKEQKIRVFEKLI